MTIQQTFDLAMWHHRARRLAESEALYRQILGEQPGNAEALHLLGVVVGQSGRLEAAVDLIGRAIAVDPGVAAYHSNLGEFYRRLGKLDGAIAAIRRAIELNPEYANAYGNLGVALNDMGRTDDAIAAYRKAIELNPASSQDQYRLGVALQDKGQTDLAIAAYSKSVELNPEFVEARSNLAAVLKDQGRLGEAIAVCRQAMALRPEDARIHSNFVYFLHMHPDYGAADLRRETGRWGDAHGRPLEQFIPIHDNDCSPNRRLRIGYVSPDLSQHIVGRNLLPLFCGHDREQFEIFCYANVARPDALTARFRSLADGWRDIVNVNDEQAAAMIRQDKIDILVDLALHSAENRLPLFARKPAPVQATFAGYPGSTGLQAIDYRLTDPYLDPPGADEAVYSERSVRLPHCFWCYDPEAMEVEKGFEISPLPALSNNFVTFGCLNNFCKVDSRVLDLWTRVFTAVRHSRLLLLAPLGEARQRVLDQLKGAAIEADRVEFVDRQPRAEYLRTYHRIDVGLDTFPYNGHTTSLDSLWMGVPVVTFIGKTVTGRAGWSQLCNLGLTELAGQTLEDFVKIATELAGDLPRLGELRRTLRERMRASPLTDGRGFARDIEAAYREMWRNWCEKRTSR